MRSPLLRAVAVFLAMLACSADVFAADPFPNKPIRIIVNSSPGALLDATTRPIALKMGEYLKQPIVVENVPGAGGLLGIRQVKAATADGYTVLAVANTIAQAPAFRLDPGYDIEKDFAGVGMMNRAPLIMVGATGHPDKTLADLIVRAKANPDQLSMATAGVGTSTHMAAALFLHQTGARMLHVPYKGNAAAMPDVVGGRVHAIFDGANTSGPLVKEGKLRAFGVTSPTRMAAYPEIPTLAEQNLPGYSFYVYMGLVVPAATPKDVVQRLYDALRFAQSSDLVRERFVKDGAEAGKMTPEEFTEYLKEDYRRTIKVATDLNLPKE